MLLHVRYGAVISPLRGKAAYVDCGHFPLGRISTTCTRTMRMEAVV